MTQYNLSLCHSCSGKLVVTGPDSLTLTSAGPSETPTAPAFRDCGPADMDHPPLLLLLFLSRTHLPRLSSVKTEKCNEYTMTLALISDIRFHLKHSPPLDNTNVVPTTSLQTWFCRSQSDRKSFTSCLGVNRMPHTRRSLLSCGHSRRQWLFPYCDAPTATRYQNNWNFGPIGPICPIGVESTYQLRPGER